MSESGSNKITPMKEKKGKQIKSDKPQLSKRAKIIWLVVIWLGVLSPFLVLFIMLKISTVDADKLVVELENPTSNLATDIYTADGKLIGKYYSENRTHVTYNQISSHVVDALIATEDERFLEHSGVDVKSLPRVATGIVKGDNSSGGGSTLSQQLAKMLFPRDKFKGFEKIKTKFKEWNLATEIEKRYTKQEIITMYLNKFDFLNQAVGIESAARVYFNKQPDSLDIHEAAMLVGMAKNPALFNPLRFPDRVKERREVVLKQWLKSSNNNNPALRNKITKAQYDSIRELPLGLDYQLVDHKEGPAPYFRETLRKEVTALLKETEFGGKLKYAKKDGSEYNIYRDGLKIYTTLDSRMQGYAEWAVKEWLSTKLQSELERQNRKRLKDKYPFSRDLDQEEIDKIMYSGMRKSDRWRNLNDAGLSESEILANFDKKIPMQVFSWQGDIDTLMSPKDSVRYYKAYLRAGLMSVDPKTGFVKAWVGGPNFHHFQYDHVKTARRQVGSTFKPFVYATGIDLGVIQPCTVVDDIKYCCDIPYNKHRDKQWCPGNAGAAFSEQPTSMKFGLANSMNNITAYVMQLAKPHNVVKFVEAIGIEEGYLEKVPALALGICDLSVFEMVGAQATFANKGVYIEPMIISRIEDKHGNVIYDANPKMTEVFGEDVAYATLSLMKGVVHGIRRESDGKYGGTAGGIRGRRTEKRPWAGIKAPMAGKTGTTQGASDGWFMGLTPGLVTGVWVGAEDRAVHFPNLTWGQGGRMALPIYGYYMGKIYDDKSINLSQKDFEAPTELSNIVWDCANFVQGDEGDNVIGDDEDDELPF